MSEFDPADPPDRALGRFQAHAVKMYEKLLARGEEETAAELRSKRSPSAMARFARQNVVEFDPKHDEDPANTDRVKIQNVYDALVELGHDARAEELREFINARAAADRASELAAEVAAEIDPVTGTVEPADEPDSAEREGETVEEAM